MGLYIGIGMLVVFFVGLGCVLGRAHGMSVREMLLGMSVGIGTTVWLVIASCLIAGTLGT